MNRRRCLFTDDRQPADCPDCPPPVSKAARLDIPDEDELDQLISQPTPAASTAPTEDELDELMCSAPPTTPVAPKSRLSYPDSDEETLPSTSTQVSDRERAVEDDEFVRSRIEQARRIAESRRSLGVLLRDPDTGRGDSGDTRRCIRASYCGEPFFVRQSEAADEAMNWSFGSTRNLLGNSFRLLRDAAESELQRHRERSSQITAAAAASPAANHVAPQSVSRVGEGRLWVEQYSPKSYLDLLSEEYINRTLLRWIKLWDKLVFNREVKIADAPPVPASLPTNRAVKDFKRQYADIEQQELNPETHQPRHRIVLLCGAPGLGKTTLAHVLARHAGYSPIEVNASDDRSPEFFARVLENATTMTSSDSDLPKCLIIDEIDGAPAASINTLINFINGGSSFSVASAVKNKKGKKKKARLLKRPIICICNDPYVPALRALRQQALVLKFPNTSLTRLTTRLAEICRKEQLRADKSSLIALCELAANDIRSCINTLEFIKNKTGSGAHVTSVSIKQAGVGRKNIKKGIFDVWSAIFTLPRPTNRSDGTQCDDVTQRPATNQNAVRFSKMLEVVSTAADYDRQICGTFEHFPLIPFRDAAMSHVTCFESWITHYDVMRSVMMSHQLFSLIKFFPFVSLAAHFLFAVLRKPSLKFPTELSEMQQTRSRNLNLVQSLLAESGANQVRQDTPRRVVLEVIPYLAMLVKPKLRSVNILLYSDQEKQRLESTVAVMLSYGLMYKLTPDAQADQRYSLEPNIDVIANFPDFHTGSLPTETAEIVARQILKSRVNTSSEQQQQHPEKKNPQKRSMEAMLGTGMNHNKPVKAKISRDFFGRVIEKKLAPHVAESTDGGSVSGLLVDVSKIWFKFKEGYSNAVKRPVKINELF